MLNYFMITINLETNESKYDSKMLEGKMKRNLLMSVTKKGAFLIKKLLDLDSNQKPSGRQFDSYRYTNSCCRKGTRDQAIIISIPVGI